MLPEGDVDVKLLINVRQQKGDPWLTVENCLVNRIVLGLPRPSQPDIVLNHGGQLMDYQKRDVLKMLSMPYFLNANPMGLGKTVEAIIAMREINCKDALIIVPKCILFQWKTQIQYWWPAMGNKVDILPTNPKAGRIAIFNYEKLLNEQTITKLKSVRWEVLICDEAHRIKNRKSKRTLAVKSLPALNRWALTGTPILNKPDDLWSILNFLSPQYSSISYWNFVNYFCLIEEGFWGRKIVGLTTNPSKIAILNTLLEVVSVRNSVVEVAHGKQVSVVKLQMGTKQRVMYRKIKDLVLDELPPQASIANGAVLTIRLQQSTSWPGIFEEGVAGVKFEWIKDLLEDNPQEKIVVFSKFENAARALKNYLGRSSLKAVLYTGKQDTTERCEGVRSFTEDPETRVIIGTIGAMGQGVDGLQQSSRTVVFLDREWSPELMSQCEGRLLRRGQRFPVIVYYLECDKSFDQYIGKVNYTKAEDIRRALQDEDS